MEKAAYFCPQITTVSNDRGKIAAAIVDMFHDLWAGRTVDKFCFIPTECVYGESCGCANNGSVDYRQYIKEQIVYTAQAQMEDGRR